MKNLLHNDYVILISRVIVGIMFLIVGVSKLTDPVEAFANEIGNYQLLPEFLINFMALTIPWIETVTGLLIMLGIRIKANSFIIAALLFVFTLGVASAMARGLNIDCGCYSNIKAQPVGWKKSVKIHF
jgi:putative oxidoreductase